MRTTRSSLKVAQQPAASQTQGSKGAAAAGAGKRKQPAQEQKLSGKAGKAETEASKRRRGAAADDDAPAPAPSSRSRATTAASQKPIAATGRGCNSKATAATAQEAADVNAQCGAAARRHSKAKPEEEVCEEDEEDEAELEVAAESEEEEEEEEVEEAEQQQHVPMPAANVEPPPAPQSLPFDPLDDAAVQAVHNLLRPGGQRQLSVADEAPASCSGNTISAPGAGAGVPLGRDKAYTQLKDMMEGCCTSGRGASVYISGLPGTGKSFTVAKVLAGLPGCVRGLGGVQPCVVTINCMALRDPGQAFGRLLEEVQAALAAMAGRKNAAIEPAPTDPKAAHDALTALLCKLLPAKQRASGAASAAAAAKSQAAATAAASAAGQKRKAPAPTAAAAKGRGGKAGRATESGAENGNGGDDDEQAAGAGHACPGPACRPFVLLLDEVDRLLKRKDGETDLLQLFSLSSLPGASVVVAAIANSLDLTERLMPSLRSRGVTPHHILFTAYNRHQMAAILKAQLDQLPWRVYDEAALDLVAKGVTSTSGDLRMALKACRVALDLLVDAARNAAATGGRAKSVIGMAQMQQALARISAQSNGSVAIVAKVKTLPPTQQLALLAIAQAVGSAASHRHSMAACGFAANPAATAGSLNIVSNSTAFLAGQLPGAGGMLPPGQQVFTGARAKFIDGCAFKSLPLGDGSHASHHAAPPSVSAAAAGLQTAPGVRKTVGGVGGAAVPGASPAVAMAGAGTQIAGRAGLMSPPSAFGASRPSPFPLATGVSGGVAGAGASAQGLPAKSVSFGANASVAPRSLQQQQPQAVPLSRTAGAHAILAGDAGLVVGIAAVYSQYVGLCKQMDLTPYSEVNFRSETLLALATDGLIRLMPGKTPASTRMHLVAPVKDVHAAMRDNVMFKRLVGVAKSAADAAVAAKAAGQQQQPAAVTEGDGVPSDAAAGAGGITVQEEGARGQVPPQQQPLQVAADAVAAPAAGAGAKPLSAVNEDDADMSDLDSDLYDEDDGKENRGPGVPKPQAQQAVQQAAQPRLAAPRVLAPTAQADAAQSVRPAAAAPLAAAPQERALPAWLVQAKAAAARSAAAAPAPAAAAAGTVASSLPAWLQPTNRSQAAAAEAPAVAPASGVPAWVTQPARPVNA